MGAELSAEEAAATLGVSVQYVRRMAQKGRLRARRGESGQWLIDADSLRNTPRGVPEGGQDDDMTGEGDLVAALRKAQEENRRLRTLLAETAALLASRGD